MHPNQTLIQKFYISFQNHDYTGMQSCYHPDIMFKDNVFSLKGTKVGAMWHMLIAGTKDHPVKIVFGNIKANENEGSAEWEASYLFSRTGRKVHNVIYARFTFKEGKIFLHHDSFDFWRWAGMAFGATGYLIGWTSFFKNKVRKSAMQRLDKFIAHHPEYAS